jgi:DNA modification methylase
MIRVLDGDCRDVVPTLDRIDAVVTDPPYHLTSGNITMDLASLGAYGAKRPNAGRTNRAGRGHKTGFMNQAWDGGDIAFQPETWWPVFTALKPGGHLVAFGGTRTFHRLVCAIEDAGFEIRDTLMWLYGTGFPKSHNISAAIDRTLGAEREVVGLRRNRKADSGNQTYAALGEFRQSAYSDITTPATPEAAQWQGWGSALKPAMELICLARKPLEGTLAQNTLKHGVGGLNIDATRIPISEDLPDYTPSKSGLGKHGIYGASAREQGANSPTRYDAAGRWPSNCLHDGSPEVLEAFAAYGERTSGKPTAGTAPTTGDVFGKYAKRSTVGGGDTGSAARFFFSSKADKADRADSKHPTVKPLDLMVWLTKLVCPPGGTVLDPFAGSGVTAEACMLNGFDCILVEKNPEYVRDIRHRLTRWSGGDLPLFAEVAD